MNKLQFKRKEVDPEKKIIRLKRTTVLQEREEDQKRILKLLK